jgi:hypothetical protein
LKCFGRDCKTWNMDFMGTMSYQQRKTVEKGERVSGHLTAAVQAILVFIFSFFVDPASGIAQDKSLKFSVAGNDTTFKLDVQGLADGFNTRKYDHVRSINSYETTRYGSGMYGYENNVALTLENNSPNIITNPRVEINGSRLSYTSQDILDQMDLSTLTSPQERIKAVWYKLQRQYDVYWTATSDHCLVAGERFISPMEKYNVYGSDQCVESSILLSSVLQRAGFYSVSYLMGEFHTVTATSLNQSVPFDSMTVQDLHSKVFYLRRDNKTPATVADLQGDQDLVRRQHHLGFTENFGVDDYRHSLLYSQPTNYFLDFSVQDTFLLTLRSNESIVFEFNHLPGDNYNYYDACNPTRLTGPPANVRVGKLIYSPKTSYEIVRAAALTENAQVVSRDNRQRIACKDSLKPAKVMIPFDYDYAVTGGTVQVFSSGADSSGWLKAWFQRDSSSAATLVDSLALTGSDGYSFDLYNAISPVGTLAMHKFALTIEWFSPGSENVGIDSLIVESLFQFNANAVPRLGLGSNTIKISSADGTPFSGLNVNLTWDENRAITQAPSSFGLLQSPSDGATIPGSNVTFRWNAPANLPPEDITDYNIQVSEYSDFFTPLSMSFDVLTSQVGDPKSREWTVPVTGLLNPDQDYHWRVAARNKDGVWSDWSNGFRFRIAAPAVPTNLRFVESDSLLSLEWDSGQGGSAPKRYRIYGSNEKGFTIADSLLIDSVTTGRFVIISGLGPLAPFAYYRIVAVDSLGCQSGPSDLGTLGPRLIIVQRPPLKQTGDSLVVRYSLLTQIQRTTGSNSYQTKLVVDTPSVKLVRLPNGIAMTDTSFQGRIASLADTSINLRVASSKRGPKDIAIPLDVNSPPVVEVAAEASADVEKPFTTAILSSDCNGDTLTFAYGWYPSWMAMTSDRRNLKGTPERWNMGDTSFSVTVSDGKGGVTQRKQTLHIVHLNHPPVFDFACELLAVEDTAATAKVHASDPDSVLFNDHVRYRFLHAPTWLAIDSVTGRMFGTPQGLSILDTTASVIAVDDSSAKDTVDFHVHIKHVNHAPVITGLTSDTTIVRDSSVALPVRGGYALAARVLAADTDRVTVGDRLTFRLGFHPEWLSIDSTTGTLHGTPRFEDVGTATVTVKVRDAGGDDASKTFTLLVVCTNRAILKSIPPVTFAEDSSVRLDLQQFLADSSLLSQSINWSVWVDTTTSGKWLRLTLDPLRSTLAVAAAPNFSGNKIPVYVKATIEKGVWGIDTIIVTVLPVNDPPRFTRADTVRLIESDSLFVPFKALYALVDDPDNPDSSLRWSLSGGQHVGVVNTADGFRLKGERYWNGSEVFVLGAHDSMGLSDSTRLTVVVSAVDDPPVLAGVPNISFPEDSSYILHIAAYLRDPDDSIAALRWSVAMPDFQKMVDLSPGPAPSPSGVPNAEPTAADSLLIQFDAIKGNITFVPAHNFTCNPIRVVISAADSECITQDTINVSVTPVNDPPVITCPADTFACLGMRYKFLVVASDPDDSAFVYSLTGPAWLHVDSTGTVQGVPAEAGEFPVAVMVSDLHGAADTLAYKLLVTVLKSITDTEEGIPQDFVLMQNYPNPFNPSTSVHFGLPERSLVNMSVYNMVGQRVDEILMGEMEAGFHTRAWHPTQLASGAYVIVFEGKGLVTAGRDVKIVKKAILLR